MKNNKIIIIILTLIFTIFLVGCPGPDIKLPNENLVLNEYGFYDGYYAYKTEVYLDTFFDRKIQYNMSNLADGEIRYFSSDSHKYVEEKNIKNLKYITGLFGEKTNFDLKKYEKIYHIYNLDEEIEDISFSMLLIDKEKNVYSAAGFIVSDSEVWFAWIRLYERISYSQNVINVYNQDLKIDSNTFFKYISNETFQSIYSFLNSELYFKINNKIIQSEDKYYLKIDNNFVLQIYEHNKELIRELLFINDNKIIETVREPKSYEGFIYTNTHKLYIETNDVIANDIIDLENNNQDIKYYQFNSLESINDYSIIKNENDNQIIIKEKPETNEINIFIKLLKELIFVKSDQDIECSNQSSYIINIDNNINNNIVIYMDIINDRYYVNINNQTYELINPTRDFIDKFYIFNDYRYW